MQEKYEDCRKNAPKMHAEATYYAAKWTKKTNKIPNQRTKPDDIRDN